MVGLARADPLLRQTKLVLLSSMIERAAQVERGHEIDATLTKPVRESRLLDCLELVLATSESPRSALPRADRRPVDEQLLGETRFAHRVRVLLVEDSEVNQRVGVRMLEKLGCAVDVASNGKQALAALGKNDYRLVFMDCQMPELDGFEATRILRESEQVGARRTLVVALTANAMAGDEQRCLDAGMDGYVAKPMRLQDLERILARWVHAPSA